MDNHSSLRAAFLRHIDIMRSSAKQIGLMTQAMDDPVDAHHLRNEVNAIVFRMHNMETWVKAWGDDVITAVLPKDSVNKWAK